MTLIIKPEHRNNYNASFRDKQLQYVHSSFHPTYGDWVILVLTPGGEFHSVRRQHLLRLTKLEVALG
jgi:hypothetical protein